MHTKKRKINSGLLPLGLVTALAATLVSFEYISAEVKYEKPVTAKMESMEVEYIPDIKIPKPDLPSNASQQNNRNAPPVIAPPVILGPIIPVVGPVDPNPPVIIGGDPPVLPWFPPQDSVIDDTPIFIAEVMPTFEKFLHITDLELRNAETQKEILNIVMGSIRYPEVAREMGIQGKVYVDFVVGKDGVIRDIAIKRGLHAEIDKESMKSVGNIPQMVPGKQRGKEVSVRYTIPIVFKLDN